MRFLVLELKIFCKFSFIILKHELSKTEKERKKHFLLLLLITIFITTMF